MSGHLELELKALLIDVAFVLSKRPFLFVLKVFQYVSLPGSTGLASLFGFCKS